MKLFRPILLLSVLLPMLFIGCSSYNDGAPKTKRPQVPEVVDIEAILKQKKVPEKRKAEKLTLAGEKLVSPIGFMYAHEIFTKALEIDPGNKKALFYKALLNPLMMLKGILKRIEPFVSKGVPRERELYKAYVKLIARGGLRDFLFDGKPDIDSEVKLQSFIASTRASRDKLRRYLKSNKDLVLTLRVNLVTDDIIHRCSVRKIREGVYESSPCNEISVRKLNVDRAEVEVLQQMVAGLQVYMPISKVHST